MDSTGPIRFGLAGLGGYAAYVAERLLDEMRTPEPSAQLVAVCEPHPDQFLPRVDHLNQHGVKLYTAFEQLLEAPIDAVWLPLPIDLHRPFTEMALRAGKAVLCEKPAAGSVDDVDAMIAARDAAGLPAAVGFQDAYQPVIADVKRRIMDGEFGRALNVRVLGCWPRNQRYFSRNAWAGRLRRDGRWVLDGPATNALAHYLHLPLLLLGPTLQDAIYPTDVAAELYRVNDIESYDTCSIRLTLPGDVPMHVAYTHACVKSVEPLITMEFERATLRYLSGQHLEIQPRADGASGNGSSTSPQVVRLSTHPHHHMLRTFRQWLRDGAATTLGATLESARAHVVAINAAAEATPIYDVPPAYTETLPGRDHAPIRTIRGIVPALQDCIARQRLLHECGQAPWARTAGSQHVNGYRHFKGPAPSTPSSRDADRQSARGRVTVETSAAASTPFPSALRPR